MGYNPIASDGLLTQAMWNDNFQALETLAAQCLGRGVASGLVLSAPGGLAVAVSDGILVASRAVPLASIANANTTDTATRYVWISEGGVLSFTASSSHPGGELVCLGKVVAAGGSITLISKENRDEFTGAPVRLKAQMGRTVYSDDATRKVGLRVEAPAELVHGERGNLRLDPAAAPTSAPTIAMASPAAPGNVDNGTHVYAITYVTAEGETSPSSISASVNVADKTVNGQVELTAIPLAPDHLGSPVTSRKVYRSKAGATLILYLLATIANNTATIYTDNTADSGLGAPIPSENRTAGELKAGTDVVARIIAGGVLEIEGQLRGGVVAQQITADLQLTTSSPENQVVWTNGAPYQVRLPSDEDMAKLGAHGYGLVFSVTNTDAAQNITVATSAGASLQVLTPGKYVEARPLKGALGYASFAVLAVPAL